MFCLPYINAADMQNGHKSPYNVLTRSCSCRNRYFLSTMDSEFMLGISK